MPNLTDGSQKTQKITLAVVIILAVFVIILSVSSLGRSFTERKESRGYQAGQYTVYLNDSDLTKVDSFSVKKIRRVNDNTVVYTAENAKITVSGGLVTVDKGDSIESYSGAMVIKG